ncbi:MAG: arginine repressor [Elusimicrobia bacterium]|nr:arginine repressor [Elusimicrobiota bacterium]
MNTQTADPKRLRQDAVLDIVRTGTVGTQQEIVKALHKRGIEATQVSVSRDISELGLVKAGGLYAVPAAGAHDPEAQLREFLRDVIPAGPNLVVLKCEVSTAPRVGYALDQLSKDGIAGTIAGDDTVFVAITSPSHGRAILTWLRSLAPASR